eukprot:scaffold330446_cov44-Prasinocladus_malaysianus.AAC.1
MPVPRTTNLKHSSLMGMKIKQLTGKRKKQASGPKDCYYYFFKKVGGRLGQGRSPGGLIANDQLGVWT